MYFSVFLWLRGNCFFAEGENLFPAGIFYLPQRRRSTEVKCHSVFFRVSVPLWQSHFAEGEVSSSKITVQSQNQ
jgi:hypothetical protein